MGEESTTPVYIGKYEDGAVRFEPLGEFKVVVDHDITDVYPDNMVKPVSSIQTIMKEPITLRAFLRKKGLRGFYKAIGMPGYLRTEYLFPKKKKRGTARRKRRMKVYKQRFINFINAKYGSGMIGTRATRTIIDQYIISKNELPAFAGPFEGEEE
jgi:hypothetical protein